ncbi:hypothetical protein Goklo_026542 [Gossypium klotzschianum]|uniref:Uncharacterized protein n=1 Tax=Gossypium klotzschianum TaxID=34286 RepID=A0A7J8TVB8_9ROSI|nr:hypothetical protein [Gossypium klotzschianum]
MDSTCAACIVLRRSDPVATLVQYFAYWGSHVLTVFTRNIRPSFFPSQLNRNPTLLFLRPFTIPVFTTSLAAKVLVSSTAFVETHPTICKQQNLYQWEPVVVEKEDNGSDNVLACPICYDPLTWTVGSPSYVGSKSGSNLQCKTCKKSYFGNQTHLDLVASGGSKQYDNSMPLATELFRSLCYSFSIFVILDSSN